MYCVANKLQGTSDQCSPSVKNTVSCLLHANCGANTHRLSLSETSMKRFYVACNNAYRIMRCIPRDQLSVRPYQVSHFVRTFDALLRNNLYRFFICCAISSNFLYDRFNFLYDRFKCLMLLFLQIFVFPQLFDTPV